MAGYFLAYAFTDAANTQFYIYQEAPQDIVLTARTLVELHMPRPVEYCWCGCGREYIYGVTHTDDPNVMIIDVNATGDPVLDEYLRQLIDAEMGEPSSYEEMPYQDILVFDIVQEIEVPETPRLQPVQATLEQVDEIEELSLGEAAFTVY